MSDSPSPLPSGAAAPPPGADPSEFKIEQPPPGLLETDCIVAFGVASVHELIARWNIFMSDSGDDVVSSALQVLKRAYENTNLGTAPRVVVVGQSQLARDFCVPALSGGRTVLPLDRLPQQHAPIIFARKPKPPTFEELRASPPSVWEVGVDAPDKARLCTVPNQLSPDELARAAWRIERVSTAALSGPRELLLECIGADAAVAWLAENAHAVEDEATHAPLFALRVTSLALGLGLNTELMLVADKHRHCAALLQRADVIAFAMPVARSAALLDQMPMSTLQVCESNEQHVPMLLQLFHKAPENAPARPGEHPDTTFTVRVALRGVVSRNTRLLRDAKPERLAQLVHSTQGFQVSSEPPVAVSGVFVDESARYLNLMRLVYVHSRMQSYRRFVFVACHTLWTIARQRIMRSAVRVTSDPLPTRDSALAWAARVGVWAGARRTHMQNACLFTLRELATAVEIRRSRGTMSPTDAAWLARWLHGQGHTMTLALTGSLYEVSFLLDPALLPAGAKASDRAFCTDRDVRNMLALSYRVRIDRLPMVVSHSDALVDQLVPLLLAFRLEDACELVCEAAQVNFEAVVTSIVESFEWLDHTNGLARPLGVDDVALNTHIVAHVLEGHLFANVGEANVKFIDRPALAETYGNKALDMRRVVNEEMPRVPFLFARARGAHGPAANLAQIARVPEHLVCVASNLFDVDVRIARMPRGAPSVAISPGAQRVLERCVRVGAGEEGQRFASAWRAEHPPQEPLSPLGMHDFHESTPVVVIGTSQEVREVLRTQWAHSVFVCFVLSERLDERPGEYPPHTTRLVVDAEGLTNMECLAAAHRLFAYAGIARWTSLPCRLSTAVMPLAARMSATLVPLEVGAFYLHHALANAPQGEHAPVAAYGGVLHALLATPEMLHWPYYEQHATPWLRYPSPLPRGEPRPPPLQVLPIAASSRDVHEAPRGSRAECISLKSRTHTRERCRLGLMSETNGEMRPPLSLTRDESGVERCSEVLPSHLVPTVLGMVAYRTVAEPFDPEALVEPPFDPDLVGGLFADSAMLATAPFGTFVLRTDAVAFTARGEHC